MVKASLTRIALAQVLRKQEATFLRHELKPKPSVLAFKILSSLF